MSEERVTERARTLLEQAVSELENPPAVIVFPPDSDAFIVGNRGGLIRLAIASLKAAEGKTQQFRNESWVTDLEPDWSVKGLKFDASAHLYLPEARSKGFRIRQKALGILVALAFASCLIVGFITIVRWILHWS